jgi:hypothetical protein
MAKTTYLFGSGAVAKGAATLDGEPLPGGFKTAGVELARVPLDRGSVPINRRRFILHPRGVKFTSASVAGDSPTNPELDPRANWTRVYEYKNVRIVTVTHNDDDAWPLGCFPIRVPSRPFASACWPAGPFASIRVHSRLNSFASICGEKSSQFSTVRKTLPSRFPMVRWCAARRGGPFNPERLSLTAERQTSKSRL